MQPELILFLFSAIYAAQVSSKEVSAILSAVTAIMGFIVLVFG